jgi:glutamyl-tRNA(Gln) amidotransferase subunit E
MKRLNKELDLEKNKIEEFLKNYNEIEIKKLIEISNLTAKKIYEIIFNVVKDIKSREKIKTYNFKYNLIEQLLNLTKKDNLSLKTIRDIYLSLFKDEVKNVENLKKYIEEKNLIVKVDLNEITKKVKEIISKFEGAPFGALMGHCQKEFKGVVDGKILSEILKKELN